MSPSIAVEETCLPQREVAHKWPPYSLQTHVHRRLYLLADTYQLLKAADPPLKRISDAGTAPPRRPILLRLFRYVAYKVIRGPLSAATR